MVRALRGIRVGPPLSAPPPGRQLWAREYLRPSGALSAACSEGSEGAALLASEGVALVCVVMAWTVLRRARAEIRRRDMRDVWAAQEEEGSGQLPRSIFQILQGTLNLEGGHRPRLHPLRHRRQRRNAVGHAPQGRAAGGGLG